ncbi:MAG: D-tyrosyl-tRNA(Tyr) deacylase [Deltaproteobacteria bacterium]|nr:D-tyrosyl-tRNA(Tyr) deacylase [Deltaproteobacteria bacterium]
MRGVIQRVASARVLVAGTPVGAIRSGLLLLLGVARTDTEAHANWLLDKVLDLRIFEDEQGKFARSLRDVQGELMVVSQFTLLADTRKGRRPSFSDAAPPEQAVALYEHVVARARDQGVMVATGTFGARMHVELVNDGPVTIVLDTAAP